MIFIPGVNGSLLFERLPSGDLQERWPDAALTIRTKQRLSLGDDQPDPPADMLATDVLRLYLGSDTYQSLLSMLTTTAGYTEYMVADDPDRRSRAGCDTSQTDATLFVFAYDWRLSNAANADLIDDYIGCIRRLHGDDTPIDILTHSMGALVARSYTLQYADDQTINQLIAIAPPWHGTPSSVILMETGYQPGISGVLVDQQEYQRLVGFFPSIHELLASAPLFASDGAVAFAEDGWDIDGDGIAFERYTYDDFVALLNQRYGEQVGSNQQTFHTAEQGDLNQTVGVRYTIIQGLRSIADTTRQVRAVELPICNGQVCQAMRYFAADMGMGDVTVPTISSQPADALAPQVYTLTGDNTAIDHGNLVRNNDVYALIVATLNQSTTTTVAPAQTVDLRLAYYLRTLNATSVTVRDANGNGIGDITDASQLTPTDSYQLTIIPTGGQYDVTITAAAEPLDIELAIGTGMTTTQLIRYRDLVVDANASALLTLGLPDGPALQVQDRVISPTVVLSGNLLADMTPPQVSITSTVEQNQLRISITATDDDSGVADQGVRYSLDGSVYRPYTDTLMLDPDAIESETIAAFAEDRAANRSNIITVTLTLDQPAPAVYLPLIWHGVANATRADAQSYHNAPASPVVRWSWHPAATQWLGQTAVGPAAPGNGDRLRPAGR
ncbi:MAG: hypothetical protein HC837_14580 [Chloroflexaceae bacterium]|nr:hypothetical protein [Chloroflexaceae bacterium]